MDGFNESYSQWLYFTAVKIITDGRGNFKIHMEKGGDAVGVNWVCKGPAGVYLFEGGDKRLVKQRGQA